MNNAMNNAMNTNMNTNMNTAMNTNMDTSVELRYVPQEEQEVSSYSTREERIKAAMIVYGD